MLDTDESYLYTLSPHSFRRLQRDFGITEENWTSSPCYANFINYHSMSPFDIVFGSLGPRRLLPLLPHLPAPKNKEEQEDETKVAEEKEGKQNPKEDRDQHHDEQDQGSITVNQSDIVSMMLGFYITHDKFERADSNKTALLEIVVIPNWTGLQHDPPPMRDSNSNSNSKSQSKSSTSCMSSSSLLSWSVSLYECKALPLAALKVLKKTGVVQDMYKMSRFCRHALIIPAGSTDFNYGPYSNVGPFTTKQDILVVLLQTTRSFQVNPLSREQLYRVFVQ